MSDRTSRNNRGSKIYHPFKNFNGSSSLVLLVVSDSLRISRVKKTRAINVTHETPSQDHGISLAII